MNRPEPAKLDAESNRTMTICNMNIIYKLNGLFWRSRGSFFFFSGSVFAPNVSFRGCTMNICTHATDAHTQRQVRLQWRPPVWRQELAVCVARWSTFLHRSQGRCFRSTDFNGPMGIYWGWNVIQKRLGYSTTGHRHVNPEDGNINNEDENILPIHSQRTLRSIPYNQG